MLALIYVHGHLTVRRDVTRGRFVATGPVPSSLFAVLDCMAKGLRGYRPP